ncbi:MAG: sulfite exporter TauE/SafE family protein [Alphaproteobacteria bacterium]|nr:sulfite exporter TauE/SafE family protein [Alphaproteobacteria bacterium]
MQIYLPIAELSLDVFLLLAIGGGVGFLSGMFGVGGGFLLTPLLLFCGVSPAVAVGTAAPQIVASSVSGALAHWRRGNVDVPMGIVLLLGGMLGSSTGTLLFAYLRRIGQIDVTIILTYVVFLSIIGSLMLAESLRALRREASSASRGKLHQHNWLHGLPFKFRFRKSKLYISALLPVGIGFFIGVLAAIMGVGGGFIMVPAMIYLLGMPTITVIGTSLLQIIFVMMNLTFMQAWQNQTVDIVLAFVLTVGGVLGAQFGSRIGTRLRGEQLRGLLALLVLGMAVKLAYDLVATPADAYSIVVLGRAT